MSSVMVRFQTPNGPVLELVKKKPESNPPGMGEHGVANVDWATVWLPGKPSKTNVMTEPFFAIMEGGLNARAILPSASPTWICVG